VKKNLLPILFIIIILAPAVDVIFKISPSGNINENRIKASMPNFLNTGTEKFPMAFENYFSDNFNLRSDLLILNSYLKFNILHISPFVNTVLIGRDGWLFRKDYLPIYQAKEYFDVEELQHFKRLFDLREEWLSKKGIKMYFAVVPVSTSIYPEFLPNNMVSYNKLNKTDSLLNYLQNNTKLKIIDLRKALLWEKKKNSSFRMFYKTDQHWNEYGAFLGAKAIIDTLRIDFKNIPEFNVNGYKIDSFETNGHGLAATILKEKELKEINYIANSINGYKAEAVAGNNYPIPATFPYKNKYENHYQVKGSKAPKILIIRDSFAGYMKNYIDDYFKHTFYLWDDWAYRLNEDIIEAEKPDIVLFEVIEADLYNVLYGTDTEIKDDTIKHFRYTRDWINDPLMAKKSSGAHDHF
jgi:alginate O-acetyltransferase complex protein AlgJ